MMMFVMLADRAVGGGWTIYNDVNLNSIIFLSQSNSFVLYTHAAVRVEPKFRRKSLLQLINDYKGGGGCTIILIVNYRATNMHYF